MLGRRRGGAEGRLRLRAANVESRTRTRTRTITIVVHSRWMVSWSQWTASVPVASAMLARRSTVRLTVVFMVAVWDGAGNGDQDGLSRTGKIVPTTVPEVPLVRTVIWERVCQLGVWDGGGRLAGVVPCVWGRIAVEPSFSLNVVSGVLPPGSEMEPKASIVI